MAFFKKIHKKLANKPRNYLQKKYMKSEADLLRASATGSDKIIKKAMKEHGKYEYALLYQNTPEFKNKRKGVKV
ncbi:MAG TPA: hypothetical protein IAC38_01600 [Candidatus Caccovivens faecavium]|nr:hypothetical protein [Candidatus Caccovivens faecavium]